MLEFSPAISRYILETYLSEEDNPDFAFLCFTAVWFLPSSRSILKCFSAKTIKPLCFLSIPRMMRVLPLSDRRSGIYHREISERSILDV